MWGLEGLREKKGGIYLRVAIVGSRTVSESFYETLCEKVPIGASQIISGGAQGADALAAKYAQEHQLPLLEIHPNYKKYGKSAPLKRNQEILEQAEYVLALWDGTSRGTAQVIAECVMQLKPICVMLCK